MNHKSVELSLAFLAEIRNIINIIDRYNLNGSFFHLLFIILTQKRKYSALWLN